MFISHLEFLLAGNSKCHEIQGSRELRDRAGWYGESGDLALHATASQHPPSLAGRTVRVLEDLNVTDAAGG